MMHSKRAIVTALCKFAPYISYGEVSVLETNITFNEGNISPTEYQPEDSKHETKFVDSSNIEEFLKKFVAFFEAAGCQCKVDCLILNSANPNWRYIITTNGRAVFVRYCSDFLVDMNHDTALESQGFRWKGPNGWEMAVWFQKAST